MKLNKQERELTMEPKELLYRTVSTAITDHGLSSDASTENPSICHTLLEASTHLGGIQCLLVGATAELIGMASNTDWS
jgi:hypothetical protein